MPPPCCRKEKDADKPKRPLTSFLAFANERRPVIIKKAGDQKLSVPEVGPFGSKPLMLCFQSSCTAEMRNTCNIII
jgi:hypothetical protein